MLKKLWAFILKEGHTPLGKAVEHAAVAAGSYAISTLVSYAISGNLNYSTLRLVAVGAGTLFLAGLRAYFKTKTT